MPRRRHPQDRHEPRSKQGDHAQRYQHTSSHQIARKLLLKLGLYGEREDDSLLAPGEWWVRDLADEIGMPWQTLREWAIKGWIHARQTKVEKLWILWADRDELKRVRKLRAAKSRGILGYSGDLVTPKLHPA